VTRPSDQQASGLFGGTAGVVQPDVVGNDLLPYPDRQLTGDAVRLEMIFLADNEAQEDAEPFRRLDTQPAFALEGLPAVTAP
jgi:hypothetical protein